MRRYGRGMAPVGAVRFRLGQMRRTAAALLRGSTDASVDSMALQALAPLSTSYLPWSVMAMRPSAVVALLNDVVVNRRRCAVECGGGVSTTYLARTFSRIGEGHVYTVEHDGTWAGILSEQLAAEGLSERATIVHAPLEHSSLSWSGGDWYADAALRQLDGIPPIDLLIVDGPPAYAQHGPHSRYPALPYFHDRLAEEFTVVLDDIVRRGELEIVDRWEAEFGLQFVRRFSAGSIAMAHSGSHMLV